MPNETTKTPPEPDMTASTVHQIVLCDWRQPKPNPQWPDELTKLIRFAVHKQKIQCAVCEKRKKVMWTMLCPFTASTITGFSLQPSEVLEPLTLVCDDHPIAPRDDIMDVLRVS